MSHEPDPEDEDTWNICEHCGGPVDPAEANPCRSCGADFHPDCLPDHEDECG